MVNGQDVFEKLSKMTEEERKKCGLVWILDDIVLGTMMDYIHEAVGNNYDFTDDEQELVEQAERLDADEISNAVHKTELDDDTYERLWNSVCDSLLGAVECKLPVGATATPSACECCGKDNY